MLKKEVLDLAAQKAKNIIEKEMNEKDQDQLVDEFIEGVGEIHWVSQDFQKDMPGLYLAWGRKMVLSVGMEKNWKSFHVFVKKTLSLDQLFLILFFQWKTERLY